MLFSFKFSPHLIFGQPWLVALPSYEDFTCAQCLSRALLEVLSDEKLISVFVQAESLNDSDRTR